MNNKPLVPVAAAIIYDDHSNILITQRFPHAHLGGLWEFPGGKIRENESAQQALSRELKEELAVQAKVGELFWRKRFEYDIKIVDIAFYLTSLEPASQDPRAVEVADFRWVAPHRLSDFSFPPADAELIRRLQKRSVLL